MTNHWSAGNAAARVILRRLLPAAIALSAFLALLRYLGQEAGLYGTAVGIALMFVATTVLTCALVVWAVRWMQRLDRERAAAEAERDRLFAISLDLICVANHEGYFTRVNPAFEQTLGYRFEELVARPFLELVHPEDVAGTVAEMEKLADGANSFDFENRYRCADGSWKWLAWTAVPDRATGLIFAVARDVTAQRAQVAERERLLEVLEEQNDRLRRLDGVKDRLLASVSHELRTPAMSIAGFAKILRDGTVETEEERRRFIEIVARNADRLSRIVDDLLFVSEVDAGRLPIERSPVDLAHLVEDAVASARIHAAEQRIDVFADADGELTVDADAHRLAQLVDNLVTNGIKFTPPGGRVEISARCDGDAAVLRVSDTGVGIGAEEQAQRSSSRSTARRRRARSRRRAPASAFRSAGRSSKRTAASSRCRAGWAAARPSRRRFPRA